MHTAPLHASSQLLDAFRQRLTEMASHPTLHQQAITENPWFSDFYIQQAIGNLQAMLAAPHPTEFLKKYPPFPGSPRRIGIIMAGNLPLVGFQDLLHVLLAGHIAVVKPSHKDRVLMHFLLQGLPPQLVEQVERIKNVDFLIATGSNNTARQLEHQFQDTPKVIRKNRFSVAILRGNESDEELEGLARDIFLYNGMGCRNVSLVLAPQETSAQWLLNSLNRYPRERLSAPYLKLLQWEKARTNMLGEQFLPGDNIVLQRLDSPAVPSVGMLNWVEYTSEMELNHLLNVWQDQIQCVVGKEEPVAFGETQTPAIDQFADGVDIMQLLTTAGF